MSELLNARSTFLDLDYNKQNISAELEKYLLDWTFTDNLSGEIDDLQIVLQDKDALWLSSWFPTKGDELVPTLFKYNWGDTIIKTKLGKFEIDEIDGKSSATTITVKALAITENTSIRGEEKSRVWEKATLKQVFSDIAKGNNLKLVWETAENPKKDRYEQSNQTDLRFCYQLCKDEGLCLKLTNNSIVVLDEADYEKQQTVEKIRRISQANDTIRVIGYSFKTTSNGVYKACRVEHYDSKKKKTIKATFTAPNAPKVGRTLVIKQEVSSQSEALRLAKKKLREANKNATTITLEIVSYKHIDAGMTFDVLGFGKLNGKYIASRVVDKPYSVSLELRRCLEGY